MPNTDSQLLTFLVWNIQTKRKTESVVAWNARQGRLENAIHDLVIMHSIHLIVLVESQLDDASLMPKLHAVDPLFVPLSPVSATGVRIYSRVKTNPISFPSDKRRTTAQISVGSNGDIQYLTVIAVHLPSKLETCQEDQSLACRLLKRDLTDWAGNEPAKSATIILGDFNLDPFEHGMVALDCLHAISSANLVAQKKQRICQGEESRLLYNPCWSLLGDATQPPGTYYYDRSGHAYNQFWHVFDQVLLDVDLQDRLRPPGVQIITDHGTHHSFLDGSGIPKRDEYSDHLPLLFTLNL